MARPKTLKNSGRSTMAVKPDETAGPKSGSAPAKPARRPSGQPQRKEESARPAAEPRPISTRAALGFKDED